MERHNPNRGSIFREVLALCLAISLTALIVSFLVFGWTIQFGLTRQLGNEARAQAVAEAATFDLSRQAELLTALQVPPTTFGAFMADLKSKDPAGALAFQRHMDDIDDYNQDNEPLLVLDSKGQTALSRAAADIGEVKARVVAHGATSADLLVLRDAHTWYIDSASVDYPFVSPDPVEDPRNAAMQRQVFADAKARATEWIYQDHWSRWISAWAPILGPDGKPAALLEVDYKVADLPLIEQMLEGSTMIGLVVSSLMAFVVGLYWSRRAVRRVHALTEAMRQVEQGDFKQHLDDSQHDEIATMAHAFNAMTAELSEKDRMRHILEEAVSSQVATALMKSADNAAGEVVTATVLFSDIRGYTAMSEEMDPLEVMTLLNAYFALMAPIVEKHGGVVDKFIGDGMLAVFGAPVPLANSARAAVLCACEMRDAVVAFDEESRRIGRREIQIGIGINTGSLLAGSLGSRKRRNYTVLGRTVNVGARLCSKAAPGHILISTATREAAGDGVQVGEPEPLQLKGIVEPFVAFDLRGVRGGR